MLWVKCCKAFTLVYISNLMPQKVCYARKTVWFAFEVQPHTFLAIDSHCKKSTLNERITVIHFHQKIAISNYIPWIKCTSFNLHAAYKKLNIIHRASFFYLLFPQHSIWDTILSLHYQLDLFFFIKSRDLFLIEKKFKHL